MTITCTQYDTQLLHQQMLDVLGSKYSYSERNSNNTNAVYHISEALSQAETDSVNTLATDNNFVVVIA